ncbi:HEAT repeat domain-containing protein [Plantibacter sp. MCCC 1A11337]|uniref:HEAT repeat domain-containing protein n=1 Tax=Plantibacter sp. MCCC 1A11337 TaxID=2736644 RepID=UPI00158191EE|nr:HEAT repeat domain-containing protein [Plantibacter sp. MCCC 1A11337]NUJ87177.1 HEAT repeat domain-containing protein [Plantibacter sp. MCCC 1A11337]
MKGAAKWDATLRNVPRSAWPQLLGEHSGLPGPRANLSLLEALLAQADEADARILLADGGEYQAMCAAAILGSRADRSGPEGVARELSTDARWRVREGVAIGLQHLGDRNAAALTDVARRWAADASPLVQRAAVAGICEPRLLHDPAVAAVAIEVCQMTTAFLAALPPERNRQHEAGTLRQALGYCWSVAVAARPGTGLPAFRELDERHPDVAWIIRENRRKARLSSLL